MKGKLISYFPSQNSFPGTFVTASKWCILSGIREGESGQDGFQGEDDQCALCTRTDPSVEIDNAEPGFQPGDPMGRISSGATLLLQQWTSQPPNVPSRRQKFSSLLGKRRKWRPFSNVTGVGGDQRDSRHSHTTSRRRAIIQHLAANTRSISKWERENPTLPNSTWKTEYQVTHCPTPPWLLKRLRPPKGTSASYHGRRQKRKSFLISVISYQNENGRDWHTGALHRLPGLD